MEPTNIENTPAPQNAQTTTAQTEPAKPAAAPEAWSVTLDKDFADILKPQADKLKEFGLSSEHAQKFIDLATEEMKQNAAAIKAEEEALTAKWGGAQNAEKNKETALKTMAKLGFDEKDAAAMTRAIGASALYEKFFELSKKIGADDFKDHASSAVVYQPNNLDAAQAQAQVERLYKDAAFMAKINDNDPEACKRLDELIDIANNVR